MIEELGYAPFEFERGAARGPGLAKLALLPNELAVLEAWEAY